MAGRSRSRAPHASFAGEATRALARVGETELRLLRTFATVVAAGGFSAAAHELQVDLSTVSRQVAELERWLGITVARRGRGGFELTPEGERLHALAREFFGAMQVFGDDLAALGGRARPVLRLGVVDALLSAAPLHPGHDLASALARCVDEVPGLQVHLATLRPRDVERLLLAGALDAGIVAAHPAASGLEQHRLYAEPNSLYVAPGHPWHAEPLRPLGERELAEADIVADPYVDDLPDAGLASLFAAGARTRADSIEAVALLVRTGRFAGFLPDHLVASMATLSSLRAVQPARFSHAQDIVLTCRTGNADPAVRALIRAMRVG